MKWIKVAIGAVVAVLSIGIIATTVYKMTRPTEVIREVSFEIDPEEGKYYPLFIFNKILEYGDLDDIDDDGDYEVVNITSSYINNEIAEIDVRVEFGMDEDLIFFFNSFLTSDGDYIDSYIDAEGNWIDYGATLTDNVNIKLVFEGPQPLQLTGITATLISLIPLVFVGGVLLYFYKPLKKE